MHVGRVYSRKRWFPMEALNKLIPLMSFDTAQESVRQACPEFTEGLTTNGINHLPFVLSALKEGLVQGFPICSFATCAASAR